eukprot:TRINITY_DN22295_c0_g1_i1.p1 TRINITY_DN22295_c0_g1~~TRINITY_DN22295_c0_g1_i1.p1  ORF type:complete len:559 (+),score=115.92 TRINITY_DN22295_c0_g1_i1:35-1678(+)
MGEDGSSVLPASQECPIYMTGSSSANKSLKQPAGFHDIVPHLEAVEGIEQVTNGVSVSVARPRVHGQDKSRSLKASENGEHSTNVARNKIAVLNSTFSEKDAQNDLILGRIAKKNLLGLKRRVDPKARSGCLAAVEHAIFKYAVALMICCNTAFLGVEADVGMDAALSGKAIEDSPAWVDVVNQAFFGFFTLELVLRLCAHRMKFFVNEEKLWNWFDFFLVVLQFTETFEIMSAFGGMRVMRLLRLSRTLRMIRLVTIFKDLRHMVLGVTQSLLPLFWANVLMFLVTYACSIAAMNMSMGELTDMEYKVVESILKDDDVVNAEELAGGFQTDSLGSAAMRMQIMLYFSSVPRAMWSLLLCITGGIDWYQVAKPLLNVHPACAFGFTMYVMFVCLGLLNVLAAIFVENALKIHEKDLLIMAEIEKIDSFLMEMAQIFKDIDLDESCEVTKEELGKYISQEHSAVYLRSQGLDVSDIMAMFDLMDADATGTIDLIEFLLGSLRLKGGARCLDICNIMQCMQHLEAEVKSLKHCGVRCEALNGAAPAIAS